MILLVLIRFFNNENRRRYKRKKLKEYLDLMGEVGIFSYKYLGYYKLLAALMNFVKVILIYIF